MKMRRFFTVICAAAAILSSAACSKFSEAENVTQVSEGKLVPVTLSVELPSVSVETRSVTAYKEMLDYEEAVYSIQYLVFNASNKALIAYKTTTSTSEKATFYYKKGLRINVYAFVNFSQDLSTITSSDELDNLTITITGNEKTTGFPMVGRIIDASGSSSTVTSVTVKHLLSRSTIVAISNKIPERYNVKEFEVVGVYLMNMPSKSTLYYSGWGNVFSYSTILPYQNREGYDGTFYNYRGRNVSYADDPNGTSDAIVDGVTNISQLSELAYYPINTVIAQGDTYTPSTPYIFYHLPCYYDYTESNDYPNKTLYTSVVMVAKLDGVLNYYRYSITGYPGSAATYDFSFQGYGASDPISERASLTSIQGVIYIDGWTGGSQNTMW